jgi:hypothetical protein
MKRFFFATIFCFSALFLFAQTSSPTNGGARNGMYIIPQTIYVGDSGRLVLPLGAAYAEIDSLAVSEPHLLPIAADVVINRMEIETRTGLPRLLVDFRAYVPGIIELPPLNLGSYEFSGLKVEITSILEAEGDRVLSDAAPPMPVPGTLPLIYGSIIGIILILLFALIFVFRGIPYLKALRTWQYRKSVLRSLKKSLAKMRASLSKNTVSVNELLAQAAQDFRKFLSFFTKINCFTMVAKEFLMLKKMMKQDELKGGETYIAEHAEIVYRIFKRCDDLRFSGMVHSKENILQFLDSILQFAAEFEAREKESLRRKTLPNKREASS